MAQNNQNDFDEQTGQLVQALDGLKFPASKSIIVNHARSNDLNPETLSVITNLPDREYQDLRDVLDHFAGGTERIESDEESSSNPS